MFMRRILVLIAAASLLPMLSCGGGGGSSPPVQPPVNTATLPITADNAQDIVEAVLGGVVSAISLVDLVDLVGLPAVGGGGIGPAELGARDRYLQAVFTQIVPCDTGEVTVEWNDVDDSLTISTGDAFDMMFDACFFQDAATTFDGLASISAIEVVGDPFNQVAPWSFAATFGFVDLSGTDGSGDAIINGSLGIEISSADNVVIDLAVTSNSIGVRFAGNNETISNFLATQTRDLAILTSETAAGGTYTSTILEGTVTFETLQSFVVAGDSNPSAGQMLIADDDSSVLVTVLDNIDVQLEIDLDRNGTIDHTLVVPWNELGID